uniref:KIB1-4 beta-propeller domain-containing protein n=1 Tax=Aegilops tauschii TaxID=37682 RepID=M8BL25_AEGTA
MVRVRVASPLGRVRFTAVCRSWRAAAFQQPTPPALPLLLLSPVDRCTVNEKCLIYCAEEGGILQVPLSEKQRHFRLTDDYEQDFIWKIVFSKVPTSGDCILVAMTAGRKVALCKIGCPDGGWTIQGCDMEPVGDIIFCREELYGLAHSKTLCTFDIGVNEDGAPIVTAAYPMDVRRGGDPMCISWFLDDVSYICELNAMLLQGGANKEEYVTKSEYGDLMFHRKDQSVDNVGADVESILSVRYYIKGGHHLPMWCLPPDF